VPHPYFLTKRESQQIRPLAREVAIERGRENTDYLRGTVRAYVGAAEGAEEAVLERCLTDPQYLDSIVTKYVDSLSASGVLDLLQASLSRHAIAERLGSDPFDPRREEAHRRAGRFINSRAQREVVALGIVVFCLMGLFPPRKMERWKLGPATDCGRAPDTRLEVRYAGHHFAFNTRYAPATVPAQGGYVVYKWYLEMLLLQWLALFVVIVVACAALRDRRSFERRVADLEKAPL